MRESHFTYGAIFYCRTRYENFEMPKHGYEQMDEGTTAIGIGYADQVPESPMSYDDYERPPLRHIDKYVRAECPCFKTIRYTVALMTCLGFIISFGMRCNMGMAKLKSEVRIKKLK